jgi:hypothetical protein
MTARRIIVTCTIACLLVAFFGALGAAFGISHTGRNSINCPAPAAAVRVAGAPVVKDATGAPVVTVRIPGPTNKNRRKCFITLPVTAP